VPLKVAARPVECHYFGVPPRLLAIAVIVGFATACTGGSGSDPKPSPTPTTRPTTSIVTSPSPTPKQTGPLTTGPNVRPGEKPPQFPSLARQHSQSGARAFGLYYFRAFDWGYAVNDGALLAAISRPSCKACDKYLRGLRTLRARKERLEGGRITVRSSSVERNNYKIRGDFVVHVRLDEQVVYGITTSGDREVLAPALLNDRSLVFVSWIDGAWRVEEVTQA